MGPAVDVAKEKTRLDKWVEYRKWTVTQLVKAVHDGAKQIKPQAKISAAVFYDRKAADSVCQDWYTWLKDGLLDYACPMAYLMENEKLKAALQEWQAADPKMTRIIPGLSLYMMQDRKVTSRPRDLVLSQVEMCRSCGAHGNLFFSIGNLNDDLTGAFADGPYEKPAQPYYP